MTCDKSVAEMLREKPNGSSLECYAAVTMMGISCRDMESCMACHNKTAEMLADAIEAEKAVDVAALNLLCDKLEMGGESNRNIAMQIRAALNGAERTKTEYDGVIPEGVEWPRFTDGELVRFGDKFVAGEKGSTYEVVSIKFHSNGEFSLIAPDGNPSCFYAPRFRNGEPVKRPEPEVLDADGVPIKVGDAVWYCDSPNTTEFRVQELAAMPLGVRIIDATDREGIGPWVSKSALTHRKPDTQEAIDADAAKEPCVYFNGTYLDKCDKCKLHDNDVNLDFDVQFNECRTAMNRDLLERQRKLLGGE